jgi:hypothetical protein
MCFIHNAKISPLVFVASAIALYTELLLRLIPVLPSRLCMVEVPLLEEDKICGDVGLPGVAGTPCVDPKRIVMDMLLVSVACALLGGVCSVGRLLVGDQRGGWLDCEGPPKAESYT